MPSGGCSWNSIISDKLLGGLRWSKDEGSWDSCPDLSPLPVTQVPLSHTQASTRFSLLSLSFFPSCFLPSLLSPLLLSPTLLASLSSYLIFCPFQSLGGMEIPVVCTSPGPWCSGHLPSHRDPSGLSLGCPEKELYPSSRHLPPLWASLPHLTSESLAISL